MKILICASEAVPYLRTSDLANVVTGLSTELRRKHDVRVVLPHYRNLEIEPTTQLHHIMEFPVHLGAYTREAHVQCLDYKAPSIRLPIYLVGNDFYFGRDNPYGYLDDYERFIFFTRAIIEMLGDPEFREKEGWLPEVIHGHDWIAGLLPMCLRHTYKGQADLASIACVYTIHNARFSVQFGYRAIKVAELDELGIYRSIGETPNKINFMARGILAADAINTVSPRHAEEISNAGYSSELTQALRVSRRTITGILNGFDYGSYKRTLDKAIMYPFDQDSLELRQENKKALQEECELTVGANIPLLGWISRLIPDKGIGLLEEIIPKLVEEDIQIVIAGIVGDDYRSREILSRFKREYPRHVAPIFTSGDSLFLRKVVAGADIILIPSIREPCGSQQMAALRYGAIPVVRNTGGLADTVTPWNDHTEAHTGKGFLFDEPAPESFLRAIREAVELYRTDPGKWQDLQVHNMGVRFSWRVAAEQYVELYETAIKASKTRLPLEKGEILQLDESGLLLNAILEISELGVTIVDQEQYLVQVARKIRELMKSDAVLIWLPDEADPQQLSPIGHSFQRHGNGPQFEFDSRAYRDFLEQDNRSWQYIFHLKSEGEALPSASLGFLGTEVARKRGWVNQLSVPVNAQGVFLGKIDVFSCETKDAFSVDIHILQAFGSAVAVGLEKTRASKEARALLTTDREMVKVHTVAEVVEVVLRHAKNLTHAEAARLDLSVGRSYSYTLDSNDQFRVLPPSRPVELQPGSQISEGGVAGNIDPIDAAVEATAVSLPPRTGHGSQIQTAFTNEKGVEIGTITVSKAQPSAFLRDEERVLRSLALQATNVLQAAYSREQDDQSRVGQLRKLAASLVGGVDFDTLLRKVVSTTADVLQAEAASLYLINDNNQLVIQAAHGYHELLLAGGSAMPYDIGEGITGWLAERGETFKADSLDGLHAVPQWKGKHKGLQNEREPSVFLGIPLKVTERANQQERVIGVLKLEDRIPQRPFTDQDMRLGEMMANVIATVIQNTRLSETSLHELNANLRELSTVLVGGLEMRVLVQRIVNKIAEVVGADASSLYLIEPGTQMLTIRAATGYQSGLVAKGAEYDLQRDKGITAWIARTGRGFKANSVDELRQHPEWAGKHNPDQGGREPNAFLGIPLKVIAASGSEETIGVLKVEDIRPGPRHPESYFTEQDEVLVEMMGNVITTVIQNTRLSETSLRELNANLRELSTVLVGGLEMRVLVQRIVNKIAEVVGADASSLYLIEPGTQMLTIRAATGYQSELVEKGARYNLRQDKGITAWIARTGQSFKASSKDELRQHPEWVGKHNPDQGNREPNAFLGIPLKVITAGDREETIGVLKVEDIRPGPRHPESYFTEQDEVLVEMMGNVITTVIQNTRLNDIRLRELNTNLLRLSTVMVGGLEMRVLVQRIVNTIAEVVGADASSLYLIEPGTQVLTIQAATGYQSGLVAKGAAYDLRQDKGITAWIARTGRGFKANGVDELRQHPEWAGKHNPDQGGREPNAFLGIPLRVIAASGSEEPIGVLKVEDIRPSPRHPESYFTEQDEVLVEMMGNVITTVIQNTRLSNTSVEELLSDVFVSLVPLKEDPYRVLQPFVSHRNEVVLNAISQKILSLLPYGDRVNLEEQINALETQTVRLLDLDANPELFRILAKRSGDDTVSRWYDTLYALYQNPRTDRKKITHALSLAQRWHDATIADVTKRVTKEKPRDAARILATNIAQSTGGKAIPIDDVGQWVAFEMSDVLAESSIRIPESLHMLFFTGAEWRSQEDMADFCLILSRLKKVSIISVVSSLQKEDWKKSLADLRRELEIQARDFIAISLTDALSIVSAKEPQDVLLNRLLLEINLLTVSPYRTRGPASEQMFFGREREIREITDQIETTSYAIIGGRRAGKSSFLLQLHRTSLPGRGLHSVYHDCSRTANYDDFLAARPRTWQRESKSQRPFPLTFGELLRLPSMDVPLVLLLDEADKLIPADRAAHWPLFNTLRDLASLGQIHVILCGERKLRSALKDDNSPLFNFVNERPLGPLDYPAVEKLVTRPMQQMGIVLIDEDAIVKRIWDFTSGHPNVVQGLCHRLIVRLNERRWRQISLDDVEEVINDPEFQEVDFLETYLAQATSLERIIALLMVMNKGDKPYRLQSIIGLLNAHDLHPDGDVVKDALDRLTDLRSILKRGQAGYEFAVKAFPKVLENRVTAEDMLIKLKSEYIRDPADVKESVK